MGALPFPIRVTITPLGAVLLAALVILLLRRRRTPEIEWPAWDSYQAAVLRR